VIEGEKIVDAISAVGSQSGNPKNKVTIVDSGVKHF
jgi:hypothetical protein